MLSIDVDLLPICVLGNGCGLNFACLDAAMAAEAAAKTRMAEAAQSVSSYFHVLL